MYEILLQVNMCLLWGFQAVLFIVPMTIVKSQGQYQNVLQSMLNDPNQVFLFSGSSLAFATYRNQLERTALDPDHLSNLNSYPTYALL